MTKSDLIARFPKLNPHLRSNHAEQIIDTIFEEISKTLVAGGRVDLHGFDIFSIKKRKARLDRNPRSRAKAFPSSNPA